MTLHTYIHTHTQTLLAGGLPKITDAAIKLLVVGCRYLTELKLSHCTSLTASAFDSLQAAIRLKSLDIYGISTITINLLVNIAKSCLDLRELVIMASPALPDDTSDQLRQHLPQLKCHFAAHEPIHSEPKLLSASVDISRFPRPRNPFSRHGSLAHQSLPRGSSAIHVFNGAKRFSRGSTCALPSFNSDNT